MRVSRICGMLALALLASGCNATRSSSSFTPGADLNRHTMLITPGDITDRPYEKLGAIESSAKKLTAFSPDPNEEDANLALEKEAKKAGADAVINVVYTNGMSWDSWRCVTANGMAVKYKAAK